MGERGIEREMDEEIALAIVGPYRASARPSERPPSWRQRFERWLARITSPSYQLYELAIWTQERGAGSDELRAMLAVERLPATSWARVRAFGDAVHDHPPVQQCGEREDQGEPRENSGERVKKDTVASADA